MDLVGSKLKEAGYSHWKISEFPGSNLTGFTALPGGMRSYYGSFNYQTTAGYWWSSMEFSDSLAYFWNLRYKSARSYRYIVNKTNGFSVRCIKDKS